MEIKKWSFNIFEFDRKTKEIKFNCRFITKAMSQHEFKKLLKKELSKYEKNISSDICYKIGDW